MAGRHQKSLTGGGDGDRGGEIVVVTLIHHHGNQNGTQGSGVRGSGAGDSAEEIGGHDIHHRHAAAHPAHTGVGQRDQLFGNTSGTHETAHGDKEGDRHQAEGADSLNHQLADRV